jgi:hypothetical protein
VVTTHSKTISKACRRSTPKMSMVSIRLNIPTRARGFAI